ncbi:hypothetical protein BDV29DRAFT_168655 [Aspergillus leporis]|uniref:Uncharacterized protein n=1 Tax=Aspergillus leporis TaxID=41062 RepID=A0A5N5XB05_9EURO|nr:hypothetical protein BDV29DRAFT_168655 [Aspergillus leporis]
MLFFTSKLLLALPGLSLAADNGGAFGPFEGHCEHGCAVYCWGGQESCRIYGPAKTTVWPWYGGCKGATKCEAYGLCGPQCLDDHGSPYGALIEHILDHTNTRPPVEWILRHSTEERSSTDRRVRQ